MNFRLLALLLMILMASSCDLLNDKYKPEEIQISEVMYARVYNSNPIAVWSEEFGLDESVSSLFLNGKLGANELTATIYAPPKRLFLKRSAVLVFHGGGFMPGLGTKNDAHIKQSCLKLAQHGIVAIAVEYRLMNLSTPSFIKAGYVATQDAKAALKYFSNHSEQYQINRRKFHLMGFSAGAIVALQGAFLDAGEPILNRARKLDNMYGHINSLGEENTTPYDVSGVVNIAGGVYDVNILDGNHKTRTLNVHAVEDNIIPFDYGVPFKNLSTKFNQMLGVVDSILARFPGVRRKIDEAKMFNIYGSNRIHNRMRKNYGEMASQLIPIEGDYHSFMYSQNGLLTTQGESIFQQIIQFIR
jgi:hypothetical protein